MKFLPFVIVLFSFCFSQKTLQSQCLPVNLKCEYLLNPIGIDAAQPRLCWQMDDSRQGATQLAYQVCVGTDSVSVANGVGNMLSGKKVKSDAMLFVYNGKPLQPFTRYFWTVIVWDLYGKKSKQAPVASFETGMMQETNLKGNWITDSDDIALRPAGYFRNVFLPKGKVKSARIYIAVAGLYELSLNGNRIGDHRLDPMNTRFDRRTLYVTYDVTHELQTDTVVVGVLLGNGWYNHQSTAVWNFDKAPWRARPRFCMNLRITYENGTSEAVTSGSDWKTALSPVTLNSIYTGEHYDARLELPDWNKPCFDDSKWQPAMVVQPPSVNTVAQAMQPIRDMEVIPPKSITKINDSLYLFDIGRNISGVSKFSFNGVAGTTFRMKHAERLNKEGRADQSNIDVHYRPMDDTDPFQTDIFIIKGNGNEVFRPCFNYKGFRYVEVACDRPVELKKENLEGIYMHSDVPETGTITSSNPLLDKIWKATNNSYLSNLFGYPTDCPQREKNGWTGDAHIASETGLYNFDAITVYEKWMADHRDEQQADGVFPSIIPTGGWGYEWGNGPDWTSTIAIIPWNIYLFYGDTRILEQNYAALKKYVDHITSISPEGLTNWGLGDWVPVKSVTPKEFTSSIYYFTDALILAKEAKLLNQPEDYTKYLNLSKKIADAINSKYLDRQTGIYGSGLQTELSTALYWGIVPDELKDKVAKNLAERVLADSSHVDVGILGAKAILNALSDNGYAQLAYTVATQETFPSWGYWIQNGATTLLENWPVNAVSDISQNHIMFGEIGAWFYKGIGGIKPDPQHPGFKNVLLQPHFVKGLDHFRASHSGPYGQIVSSWKREGERIFYTVIIPPNSSADLYLEGKVISLNGTNMPVETSHQENFNPSVIHLAAGRYEFVLE